MVVKCVSFLDDDQINIIPETCNKTTVNKGKVFVTRENYGLNIEKGIHIQLTFYLRSDII